MSRFGLVIRYLLFCVFFTAGAGAIVLSVLIEPELLEYYQGRQMLNRIEQENQRIRTLTDQYQSQIDLIRSNPGVQHRLQAVTLGRAPATDENTIDPAADSANLAGAAQTVIDEIREKPAEYPMPDWFGRCRRPNIRRALFAAGAGLVLVTFIFFGTPGSSPRNPLKQTPRINPGLGISSFRGDRDER